MQLGQLSVSVTGASQRLGNPVVSVSNIRYMPTYGLEELKHPAHSGNISKIHLFPIVQKENLLRVMNNKKNHPIGVVSMSKALYISNGLRGCNLHHHG